MSGVQCRLCRLPAVTRHVSPFGNALLCEGHRRDAAHESEKRQQEFGTALLVSMRYGPDDSELENPSR